MRLCDRGRRHSGRRRRFIRLFADKSGELIEGRMAVDLDCSDIRAVLRVDFANPRDASDRVEAQIDELRILVNLVLSHVQLLSQELLEVADDAGAGGNDTRGRRWRDSGNGARWRKWCSAARCILHVRRQLVQGGKAVDLDGGDFGAVRGINLAHPGHAGDGVQAQVDELGVIVDVLLAHLQLLRQHGLEAGDDVGKRRRGLRGGGIHGIEDLVDLLQGVGLADEGLRVHGQFQPDALGQALVQKMVGLPFRLDQAGARVPGGLVCKFHCGRKNLFAGMDGVCQTPRHQFATGVLACGQ